MDLPLDLRTRGNVRAEPLTADVVRELVVEDLPLLEERRGSTPKPIQKVRARHHALARALAAGMSDWEASLVTRFHPSRISILKQDPTFQNLLSVYKMDVDRAYFDMHEALAGLSEDAVEELRARLEEDPESIANSTLLEILKTTTDRTGFGPQSTSLNVNVNLATRLEAARKRTLTLRAENTSPVPEGENAGPIPENTGPSSGVRGVDPQVPTLVPEDENTGPSATEPGSEVRDGRG